jgi:subtilase family serine protease
VSLHAGRSTPVPGRGSVAHARSTGRVLRGAVLFAAVTATVAAILAASGGQGATLGPRALRPVGATPPSQKISFTLLLRLPGANRLGSALSALENPRSPRFRQFISPQAFGARFGISAAALARVVDALQARGFRIVASYPQRTALVVSGRAGAASRLLAVRLENYVDAARRTFHAPVGSPSIPSFLRASVTGVTGLDSRPRWRAEDVPLGGLSPQTAPTAYDIAPLRSAGFSGRGMTIAIISFSAYDPTDPAGFAAKFGIPGPAPRVLPVGDGTTDTSGAIEANLDIDVVRSIAPGAQILFYEAPNTSSGYTDAIDRIVADHRADIISSSWGQCELEYGSRAGDSRALAAADAAGISMFVSSGDQGAYDCQAGNLPDHRLSVDWPASSAGAIGVGGTRLNLAADGTYRSEGAWEDALSGAGGGGGVSTGDRRPSWQSAPGVLNSYSNGRRQVPDVSADADPGTGWLTYSSGSFGEVGGTSAAAPFWAASTLLIRQYAAAHGVGALGYVNPMLYALASSRQRFPPFHDVVLGGNRYYQTTPGWDPATGLGSPDVYNLARDMVAYLKRHPAR